MPEDHADAVTPMPPSLVAGLAIQEVLEKRLGVSFADWLSDVLVNQETELNSAIAETNACGWGIDDLDVISYTDARDGGGCLLLVTYHATGEQDDDDRMNLGTSIRGEVALLIDKDGQMTVEACTAVNETLEESDDDVGDDEY